MPVTPPTDGTWSIRNATPNDADAIARVHVDTWRSAYQSLLSADLLAGLSYEERRQRHFQHLQDESVRRLWFVSESADDGIVGFVCGGQTREISSAHDGELYAIYVTSAFQRHGLGKKLFVKLTEALQKKGFLAMKLWVLKDNLPSRRFYESMGGRLLEEVKSVAFGERTLEEAAYGWDDLSQFSGTS